MMDYFYIGENKYFGGFTIVWNEYFDYVRIDTFCSTMALISINSIN